MYSPKIQNLIDIFSKFPTVGPRTAARFAFYLLKLPKDKLEELIKSIDELKKQTKLCPICFSFFEPSKSDEKMCPICSNKTRDRSLVCVVEKQIDQQTIEKTNKYKGLYFILGGLISNLKRKEIRKEIEKRVDHLIKNIEKLKTKEIILALNSTTEGEITSLWLERRLEPLGIKITRLATGLPKGSELEYADSETLSSALSGRN